MVALARWQQVGFLAWALCVAGCGSPRAHVPRAGAAPTSATARTTPEVLPFIHDDYAKALAESKRSAKPLFVDAWATWCHSCQSLRAYVLTDPSLAPLAGDFVWLSVDTEKEVNAPFVDRFPHSALPTLWVIDPMTERAVFKWAGTATSAELRELLSVARADPRSSGPGVLEATAAFVRGNRAVASGDVATAETELRAALAASSKDHPHRARIVEALASLLSTRREHAACAELAAREAPSLVVGTSRASVIVYGLTCAREGKRKSEAELLVALALADARARDGRLLPDDRSALYEEIVATKVEAGGAENARTLATEWAGFLEDEAKRAKTIEARTSLDPLRLTAYLALKEPARAIPMLEQSERDVPDDFNPPARLARVYLELGRLDEAEKANARALSRVYGPRIMRVLAVEADIAKARGDRAGEVAALEQAIARTVGAVLTEGQRGVRDGLVKRLATLKR